MKNLFYKKRLKPFLESLPYYDCADAYKSLKGLKKHCSELGKGGDDWEKIAEQKLKERLDPIIFSNECFIFRQFWHMFLQNPPMFCEKYAHIKFTLEERYITLSTNSHKIKFSIDDFEQNQLTSVDIDFEGLKCFYDIYKNKSGGKLYVTRISYDGDHKTITSWQPNENIRDFLNEKSVYKTFLDFERYLMSELSSEKVQHM